MAYVGCRVSLSITYSGYVTVRSRERGVTVMGPDDLVHRVGDDDFDEVDDADDPAVPSRPVVPYELAAQVCADVVASLKLHRDPEQWSLNDIACLRQIVEELDRLRGRALASRGRDGLRQHCR